MKIEFAFDGGTPTVSRRLGERQFRCEPLASQSGSQWFCWCVRVDGLEKGEKGEIELVWPRKYTMEDLPPELDEETRYRMTQHDNFAKVLPDVTHLSDDLSTWRLLKDIVPVEDNERAVRIPLHGTGEPLYIATQIPYIEAQMKAVLSHVEQAEPGAVREIGLSQAGLPLHMINLPALGEKAEDAPTIYVQAYQHITEFSGLHVVDSMLRHLVSEAGHAARDGLNWQIMPCVDVDALHYGISYLMGPYPEGHLRKLNPNRDWKTRTWPEVDAIMRDLTACVEAETRFIAGFDLHNGWWKTEASAATYTVFHEEEADPDYIARQVELIEHLYQATDHEQPGVKQHWTHRTGGRTFTTTFRDLTGGLAHTIEFSRFKWWDRKTNQFIPAHPDHPTRFGRDFPNAVHDFFGH